MLHQHFNLFLFLFRISTHIRTADRLSSGVYPEILALMSGQADWVKTKSSEIENVDDPEKGGVEGSIAQTFVPTNTQRQIRRQASTPLNYGND